MGILSTSINKILLEAQIKEYNTKLSTTRNTYDESRNNKNITHTSPQLQNVNHNKLTKRNFQEMSLTELETLHEICELERTKILQSLTLAILKISYAGYLLSGNRSNFIDHEGNILAKNTDHKMYHQ